MTSQTLLEQTVSFQENTWSGISNTLTVGQSLNLIKSGAYRPQIDRLRSYLDSGDRPRYDLEKKKLPAITFSASFDQKRNRKSVSHYNSLLVLDIDKLEPHVLDALKESFNRDPYILAYWESPSKAGLKGLMSLEFPEKFPITELNFRHTYAFRKVSNYITTSYGTELDNSGSDITRLCFFSQDEALFLRETYKPFLITYCEKDAKEIREKIRTTNYSYNAKPTKDQQYNPKGKNKQSSRTHVQNIIRFLTKRNLSITDSFSNWYQICYALTNTFTYELGRKYFIAFSKMDGIKYKEEECKNMVDYCYANTQGGYTFATVIHFAKQVGYKEEKEVPKVDALL